MAINEGSVANNLKHTINKLRIIQVNTTDSGFSFNDVLGGNLNNLLKMFEVQINPDKFIKHYKIKYANAKTTGRHTQNQKFNRIEAATLTLNFTLDGTGVIPASVTDVTNFAASLATSALDTAARSIGVGGVTDTTYVTRRIEELKKIVYGFNNTIHEPPTIKVVWGDLSPFTGKLDDLQITYTLFHPSGAPLRAEVQLQFSQHDATGSNVVGAIASGVGAALSVGASIGGALLSSPDLTHRRTVTATDKLPLLSEDIYKETSLHWQVAQANELTHFRQLETGTELFFPPIER